MWHYKKYPSYLVYLVVIDSASLQCMPSGSDGQEAANGHQQLAVFGGPGSEVDPGWGMCWLLLLLVSIVADLLL